MSKEQKADFAIILGWLIFDLVYFLPDLISRKYLPHLAVPFAEATHQWIPFWEFTSQMLNKGLMPIWCPHFFCGFPYLAYPPNNLYYPFFFLLAQFSYQTGIYLEHLLSFFFVGFFAYSSFRRIGFSPSASLAGMLCLATGFFYVNYSTFCYYARFWMFSALAFWGITGLIYDQPRLRHFLSIAFGYAMLASGDIEQAWYRLWFDLGWALYASPKGQKFKRFSLVGAAIGFGLVCLACPALINLIGYGPHCVRSVGISFAGYLENAFSWQILLAFLLPIHFPWFGLLSSFYLGYSAILFALLGIRALRRKALLAILAFLLYGLYAMGEPHLLYIFYQLPIFNRTLLHYTAAIIPFIIFAYFVAQGLEKTQAQSPSKKFLIGILILTFILFLLELFDLKLSVVYFMHTSKSLGHAWLQSFFTHWGRSILLLILLTSGLVALQRKKFNSVQFRNRFFILLLIVDFSLPSLSARPRDKLEKFELSPTLKSLLTRNQLTRWWSVSRKSVEDTELVPLAGMRLDPLLPGTHTPLAFWRVPPRKTAEVINLIAPGFVRFDENGKLEKYNLDKAERLPEINFSQAQLFSLLNVGIIISRELPLQTNWPATKFKEFIVYQNPDNLPRAFLLGKTQKAKSETEELLALSAPEFDPKQIAIVPQNFPLQMNSSLPGELQLIDFKPGKWNFQTNIPGSTPQLLFLSETYYPGWRAFLDGSETRIYRVNYAFQGVIIPPGVHQLEMRFEPVAFHLGLWTALSSYFFIGLILLSRILVRGKKV